MVHYKALFEEQLMEWCFWKDENKQKIGMFQLCRKLHNITFEKRLYDAKRSNGSANACKILMQFLFFFNTNVTTLKSWGLYIKTKKKKKGGRLWRMQWRFQAQKIKRYHFEYHVLLLVTIYINLFSWHIQTQRNKTKQNKKKE